MVKSIDWVDTVDIACVIIENGLRSTLLDHFLYVVCKWDLVWLCYGKVRLHFGLPIHSVIALGEKMVLFAMGRRGSGQVEDSAAASMIDSENIKIVGATRKISLTYLCLLVCPAARQSMGRNWRGLLLTDLHFPSTDWQHNWGHGSLTWDYWGRVGQASELNLQQNSFKSTSPLRLSHPKGGGVGIHVDWKVIPLFQCPAIRCHSQRKVCCQM